MPKTKDNSADIHLGKSPAFPHDKSINVFPFLETP